MTDPSVRTETSLREVVTTNPSTNSFSRVMIRTRWPAPRRASARPARCAGLSVSGSCAMSPGAKAT